MPRDAVFYSIVGMDLARAADDDFTVVRIEPNALEYVIAEPSPAALREYAALQAEMRERIDRQTMQALYGLQIAAPGPEMTATEVRQRQTEAIAVLVVRVRDLSIADFISPNALFREFAAAQRDDVDDEAEARGRELLEAWLTDGQRAMLQRHGWFEVTGGHSGKRYRIREGRAMNVDELDGDGRTVATWCFVPEGGLCAGDVMLAQKIALETDERAALAVANRHFVSLQSELSSPAPLRAASELRTTLPQGTWRRLYEGNPVREPVDSARWTG